MSIGDTIQDLPSFDILYVIYPQIALKAQFKALNDVIYFQSSHMNSNLTKSMIAFINHMFKMNLTGMNLTIE